MLYVGYNTEGKVVKITNELDDTLEYLEISAEMFTKFAECTENIDDYIVVKKQDYVLEKKDKKESVSANIFTISKTTERIANSIYIIQDHEQKSFSITHTFKDKFPPSQTYKKFFVTDVNNSNKLLCTLECRFEDFFDKTLKFDTKYFSDCKIITQPDMQSYYHLIGETIE